MENTIQTNPKKHAKTPLALAAIFNMSWVQLR